MEKIPAGYIPVGEFAKEVDSNAFSEDEILAYLESGELDGEKIGGCWYLKPFSESDKNEKLFFELLASAGEKRELPVRQEKTIPASTAARSERSSKKLVILGLLCVVVLLVMTLYFSIDFMAENERADKAVQDISNSSTVVNELSQAEKKRPIKTDLLSNSASAGFEKPAFNFGTLAQTRKACEYIIGQMKGEFRPLTMECFAVEGESRQSLLFLALEAEDAGKLDAGAWQRFFTMLRSLVMESFLPPSLRRFDNVIFINDELWHNKNYLLFLSTKEELTSSRLTIHKNGYVGEIIPMQSDPELSVRIQKLLKDIM